MLHIFTLGSGEISRFDTLKQSADFSGLNINFVEKDSWNGFYDKIVFMKEQFANIPDHDIICFIDGFDVITTTNREEIYEKFIAMDCDVLFSAESNAFPAYLKESYQNMKHTSCFKYLNSGGMIGYKHALVNILNWKTIQETLEICANGTDQAYFSKYYLENYEKKRIKLDTNGSIFLSLYGIHWEDFEFKNGRLINKVLHEMPCFLHFNGNTMYSLKKDFMMPIFLDKMRKSLEENVVLNLAGYEQEWTYHYFRRVQTNTTY